MAAEGQEIGDAGAELQVGAGAVNDARAMVPQPAEMPVGEPDAGSPLGQIPVANGWHLVCPAAHGLRGCIKILHGFSFWVLAPGALRFIMRKIAALLLSAILFLSALLVARTKEPSLVFTHVTVIDVAATDSRRALKPDHTVVITGSRIDAMGKTGKIRVPAGAQVVDASGKFLIPGLWDMHVHALLEGRPEYFFPLFIANGVTGVRDMGSSLPWERIRQMRGEIADGRILGPRFGAVPGRILDGPGGRLDVGLAVATAGEGRQLVQSFKRQGADFIKVYNLLPRDVYLAIVDEAKKQGVPVAGHVPFSMTAAEVSDLGQKSIEHTTDLFTSCSRDEAALRQELRERARAGGDSNAARVQVEMKAAAGYDERKAAALFARFVRNGTWLCPTLAVRRPTTSADLGQLDADVRLKYIPPSVREGWRNAFAQRISPSGDLELRKMRFQKTLEIVDTMQRAGVGILAGTDILNPYVFPGFSLHDELTLLVQAGLPPMAALQAATVNPAKFLRLSNSLGTVEKGKIADLVLLEANPLEDISNTQRISAVVVNGRYFPKETLRKMLAEAEAAASKK
jgi:imidazolonepropionase-like amidohydrolase